MREAVADEPTFKGKVKKMLDTLKDKYKKNYKVLKHIDHVEPLYDVHDFWDN